MDTTNSSEKPQRRVKHGQRPTEPLADWPAEFGAAGAEQPAATSGDAPADLQQLKALALAATPGPWTATHWNGHAPTTVMRTGTTMAIAETTGFGRDSSECAPDAAYIAAANPAFVLGLIAQVESLYNALRLWKQKAEGVVRIESAAAPAEPLRKAEELPATASGDERAAFEAWSKRVAPAYGFDRDERDQYVAYPVHAGWAAWQARAAVSAATKPTADLSSLTRYSMWSNGAAHGCDPAINGRWVEFDDVQSLLATKPAAAPAVPKSANFNMLRAMVEAGDKCNVYMDWRQAAAIYEAALAVTPAASTTGAAQTVDQVRNQALEEAAKTAEATRVAQVQYGLSIFQDGDGTRDDIATAIRALKRPTPTHSSEAGDAS